MHMFDVPHTINVLNSYEYKIFYEVQRKQRPGGPGDDHFMCKRVFLARKGDNTGNSTGGSIADDIFNPDDLFF